MQPWRSRLCRLVFGHELLIEVNERENKSEYVCQRCRAVVGDFVTNLRKSGAEPVERPPATRYGKPPRALAINCSDGANWPVLASFDDPHNGARHSAQFGCSGQQSTFALTSEK
jgi:hypothetical protein